VALVGVDHLVTRQLISGVGWALAIDVGLGNGAQNFDSILLHRFPGHQRSEEIEGWASAAPIPVKVPMTPGFTDLMSRYNECGVVELAGKAVGASFVGVIAATLAIAEPLRDLNSGHASDRLRFDLTQHYLVSAVSSSAGDVTSASLRPPRPTP
jgi:hypothetical protein